jgi:hypothetical protein
MTTGITTGAPYLPFFGRCGVVDFALAPAVVLALVVVLVLKGSS